MLCQLEGLVGDTVEERAERSTRKAAVAEPASRRTALEAARDSNVVAALLRGLAILDAFSETQRTLGVVELSRRLGVHKSTVSRLAATLEAAGYLERLSQSGKYQLGWRATRLGCLAIATLDLRHLARPALEALVRACGQTAHLGVLDGTEVVTTDFVEGTSTVRMHAAIGKRSPAYCSALGKALLATLPEEEVAALFENGATLQARTPNTLVTLERLFADLRATRARGYAFDNEELEPGLCCVGASIFDATGRAVAAVSISGPAMRVNAQSLPALAAQVKATVADISRRLGAPPMGTRP